MRKRASSPAGAESGWLHAISTERNAYVCARLSHDKNFTSMYVYAFMVCAFRHAPFFRRIRSVCFGKRTERRVLLRAVFTKAKLRKQNAHQDKLASAGVAFAPKGSGEHTHTKEQYKTPHVQCLCTRVWETHIIGYQFDNEAGSEARFSFADCFLGVSIR